MGDLELVRRRGRVAEEGTRVGCVEHEEEAWSIANTLRTLQIQIHSEHCKCKRTWTKNTDFSNTSKKHKFG